MDPNWMDLEDVLRAHRRLLARFGGIDGVRDPGMLESALGRPQHLFAYSSEARLVDLAACYAHGIVKNHPFLDGNKRTGFLTAALFLETNGGRLTAPEEEAVLFTVGLAAGQICEGEYAEWLQRNCTFDESPA